MFIFRDSKSLTERPAFLNANYAVWQNDVDTGTGNVTDDWTTLLRTALKLEIALFASAFDE